MHQPWLLGPWRQTQQSQTPPSSLKKQFFRGQRSLEGCEVAYVVLLQTVAWPVVTSILARGQ